MDDIEQVDCFERLHQHLLQHVPDLQRRTESLPPPSYCSCSLDFLQTHLVSLVSGMDDSNPEGKRRIYRFLADFEMRWNEPGDEHDSGWLVQEKGGIWNKSPRENLRKGLQKSIRNLIALSDDPTQSGAALDRAQARLEHLPARLAWFRKSLPCLPPLGIFRYLARIGYPVVVPDTTVQAFFFRLGLMKQTDLRPDTLIETCHVAESIAVLLNRRVREIDLWIRAFTGVLSGGESVAALCRREPACGACPLQVHCQHFRFIRPRAQGGNEPLPFKEWHASERPRERLAQTGAANLDDSEILAIVLRTGSGKTNVLDLARQVLSKFGSLKGIDDATLEDLKEVHGIGPMKAIEIKAALELGRRLVYRPIQNGDTFRSSADVFQGYRARFSQVKQEEFILLMLDNKNIVTKEEVISRGSLNASIVHPREVFKAAIKASAAGVLFVHNHPSGDPSPSQDDRNVTQRLKDAAELLQIRMLDHVIIGSKSFFSFSDDQVHQVPDA